MSKFVESLRRLYAIKHFITLEYMKSLLESGKISQKEYDYIVAA